jgi:hypothetical protein
MTGWIIALIIGVIASVIGAIIAYYVFGIGKPKQVTAPSFSSITPSEIRAELDKVPPFQLKQAYSSYRGRKVKWDIEFSDIHTLYGIYGFYHSGTISGSHLICFRTHLGRYPEIKTMKRGDKFTVLGTISSVDSSSIHLKKCHLIFNEQESGKKPESNQAVSKQIASVLDNNAPVLPAAQPTPTSALSASQPTPIQLETKPKRYITPEEIRQSLKDVPPFQTQQVMKNFEGIEIEWFVELRSIRKYENELFIMTRIPKSNIAFISFKIDMERYPELKIMKAGELFTVKGEIDHITAGVDLDL